MSNDVRFHMVFYGININDWEVNFGSFSHHHKILTEDYISDGCLCDNTSSATLIHEFIYGEHIKKVYFIEGLIKGQVTFAASSATAYICKYKVTVCKVHINNQKSDLFTTDWVTVDDTLTWDSDYNIGQEKVYPFRIDAYNFKELNENERIYIRVESTCSDNASHCTCKMSICTNIVLWHSNDATWEDLKIDIPMRL